MPQLAANPWKVTSADALPLIITKGSVKLRHIEFSNYAVIGDLAVVQDRFGNDITRLKGTTDIQEVRTGNIGYVDGVTILSISAGEVLIYFE
jgi:hypothetical protein